MIAEVHLNAQGQVCCLPDGGEFCGREDDLPVLSVPVAHGDPFNGVTGLCAAMICASDAENYLEIPIYDRADGHCYLLTFCRSKQQTPDELRKKAEKELADARERIHRQYAAAAWGVRTGSRPSHIPDTFAARVNAVLDVLRNLSLPFLEESDV